jgi:hypothetical protein
MGLAELHIPTIYIYDGHTARELIRELYEGNVRIHKKKEWSSVHILGSWTVNYVGSAFVRLAHAA